MFKIKITPKFKKKSWLRLKVDYYILGKYYPEGYLFKIIGSDDIRGYDIQDSDGNIIYEIGMIIDKFDLV